MKKNTVGGRLDFIISELGYNLSSFSNAIGLSNNVTIGRIIREGRGPSFDVLEKIAQTFSCINTEWLLLGNGKPFKEGFDKNNAHPNAHPNAHLTPKTDTKNPLPGEEEPEKLHIPFSISPQQDPPGVREHPEPYGKKTDLPPGCALCHANERVIAAMQAHIDTLERELHRQQVISDELREQQLHQHQQEAQKNDRNESGQKRKAG